MKQIFKFIIPAAVAALLCAAAPAARAAQAPSASEGMSLSQQDAVNVVITDAGPNKVKVVKVIRTYLNIDLREAKELVDKADNGPVTVAEKLPKDKADAMKAELEEAGAKVQLK